MMRIIAICAALLGTMLAGCMAETTSELEEVALQSEDLSGRPSDANPSDLESLGFDCHARDISTIVCTKCYDDGSCLIYECDRGSGTCTYTVESAPSLGGISPSIRLTPPTTRLQLR